MLALGRLRAKANATRNPPPPPLVSCWDLGMAAVNRMTRIAAHVYGGIRISLEGGCGVRSQVPLVVRHQHP